MSAKGLLPGKVALCLCSSSFFALSSCWMPGFSEHRTPLYHGSALRHGESHTNSSAPGGLRSMSSCPGGEALPVQRPPGEALPTFLSPSPPQHKELLSGSSHPHPRRQIPGNGVWEPRRAPQGGQRLGPARWALASTGSSAAGAGAHGEHASLFARLLPRAGPLTLQLGRVLGRGLEGQPSNWPKQPLDYRTATWALSLLTRSEDGSSREGGVTSRSHRGGNRGKLPVSSGSRRPSQAEPGPRPPARRPPEQPPPLPNCCGCRRGPRWGPETRGRGGEALFSGLWPDTCSSSHTPGERREPPLWGQA